MKKKSFKIKMRTKKGEKGTWKMVRVNGFTTKNFGVHKTGKKRSEQFFTVTHLPTGCALSRFDFLREARKYAEILEMEDFPVSWDNADMQALRPNSPKALEMKDLVLSS